MSGNSAEDLIVRTASIILGCIPVTINWQADTFQQKCFKISKTECSIVIVDESFNSSFKSDFLAHFDGTTYQNKANNTEFVYINDLYQTDLISDSDLNRIISNIENVATIEDTRCKH